jgi:di/tricarboxylate transporter
MAVMTNILSNNATAVLFTPIALNLAQQLGVDPKIFIFAVVFACNCSFVTPIGYQTNLMVMGPGHYKFVDFTKAGPSPCHHHHGRISDLRFGVLFLDL